MSVENQLVIIYFYDTTFFVKLSTKNSQLETIGHDVEHCEPRYKNQHVAYSKLQHNIKHFLWSSSYLSQFMSVILEVVWYVFIDIRVFEIKFVNVQPVTIMESLFTE